MLHIMSQIDNTIPVYFLNTGYHFPETLAYRNQIADFLGIEVRDAQSPISKHLQREPDGRLYFASDPNHCCFLK